MRGTDSANVSQLDHFDEVIDARAPAEFAEDHIPGARNFPTLDDTERAEIGILNATRSGFDAKRRGAILAARNIARHIESAFIDRPASWRPLVYCWRGGKRSRSMVLVFREIGWAAAQLDGGYKAFRRRVIHDTDLLAADLRTTTICGETGSAKSHLLAALERHGAQVLDLEALAEHRGSVLGDIPDSPQPAQKRFETLIWDKLRRLDPARPLFVEGESKKIGQLQVPDALVARMRAGACIRIEATTAERVRFLLEEYAHFVREPARLRARLETLSHLYQRSVIARWHALADAGSWPEFVADLLDHHYDPAYRRSMERNFAGLAAAPVIRLAALTPAGIDDGAQAVLEFATTRASAPA